MFNKWSSSTEEGDDKGMHDRVFLNLSLGVSLSSLGPRFLDLFSLFTEHFVSLYNQTHVNKTEYLIQPITSV